MSPTEITDLFNKKDLTRNGFNRLTTEKKHYNDQIKLHKSDKIFSSLSSVCRLFLAVGADNRKTLFTDSARTLENTNCEESEDWMWYFKFKREDKWRGSRYRQRLSEVYLKHQRLHRLSAAGVTGNHEQERLTHTPQRSAKCLRANQRGNSTLVGKQVSN